MGTRRFLWAVIGLTIAVAGHAAPPDYNAWMKSFYRTDEVGRFDGFWRMIVEEKLLTNQGTQPVMIAFLSQVLRRHPDLIAGRLDDPGRFSGAMGTAVQMVLWYSDTKEARAVLRKHGLKEWLEQRPPPIGSKRIDRPGDLDFCWGWFFGSGDGTALDPIISALDLGQYAGALDRYKEGKKTAADHAAAYKDAIFRAAVWSLEANGRESPQITAHLERAFSEPTIPRDRRLCLATVLSKLEPDKYRVEVSSDHKVIVTAPAAGENGTPVWRGTNGAPAEPSDTRRSIGGFGAWVIATADSDWREKWNTPVSTIPHFNETRSIRIGQKVALLVFFANPRTNPQGAADVTYDLTIRKPDGRVEREVKLKGMQGPLHGLATNTRMVEQIVGFSGEPGDPTGVWEFDFAVRDAVRGVTVPLKVTVVLEPERKMADAVGRKPADAGGGSGQAGAPASGQ